MIIFSSFILDLCCVRLPYSWSGKIFRLKFITAKTILNSRLFDCVGSRQRQYFFIFYYLFKVSKQSNRSPLYAVLRPLSTCVILIFGKCVLLLIVNKITFSKTSWIFFFQFWLEKALITIKNITKLILFEHYRPCENYPSR